MLDENWEELDLKMASTIQLCLEMRSCITCWRGSLSYKIFLILTINLAISNSSRCTWSRLWDIIGSCLQLSNPSPLNPHLMYLQVLITFSARSCEEPVAPITTLHSFVINWNFLYHWISRPRTCSQKFQSSHIALSSTLSSDTNCCDTAVIISIVAKNNQVTTITVVHDQDRDRHCRIMTICNTCKRKLL